MRSSTRRPGPVQLRSRSAVFEDLEIAHRVAVVLPLLVEDHVQACQDGVLTVRMTRRLRGNANALQLLGREGGDRVLDLVHPGPTDVEDFVQ